jgi:IS5 family transposase
LRHVCGVEVFRGAKTVPRAWVYTRFLHKLLRHQAAIDRMLETLVDRLEELLPDLGRRLAVDSKAIESHGKPLRKEVDVSKPDGRRDRDADWGVKTCKGVREDGTAWEKTKRWFGYKLHLLVDADYELPLGYAVTPASANDSPYLLPLVERLKQGHPELVERSEYLSADKGYDSEENNKDLWDEHAIRPVIDIRATWKEEPEVPRPLYPDRVDTIFHTEHGEVLCRCRDGAPKERDNYSPMAYEGFEADRMTLKYRCPARAHGMACAQQDLCNQGCQPPHGRIVRVPLDTNRRSFTPLARDSKAWTREYKHRTAVERVNSRLDVSFGFERHYIRGMDKMKVRAGLALVVMLAMAVGWIQAGQQERIRSLVGRARAA